MPELALVPCEHRQSPYCCRERCLTERGLTPMQGSALLAHVRAQNEARYRAKAVQHQVARSQATAARQEERARKTGPITAWEAARIRCANLGIPAYYCGHKLAPWCVMDQCMRSRGYSSTVNELAALLKRTPVPGGHRQQVALAYRETEELDAEFRERVAAYGT